MSDPIGPGDVRVGHLVDGDPNTPHQAGALLYEDGTGPLLSVPFLSGEAQFDHAVEWFRRERPPASLLFVDEKGVITLTEIRWRGYSGATYATGRLSPNVTFYGRPRALKPAYRVSEFTSRIDGLREFTGVGSVAVNMPKTRDDAVTVALKPSQTFKWRHNGFTHRIETGATWSGTMGLNFEASSQAVLSTTKSKRASPEEYLVAQWPMRALLVLAFGTRLNWRRHTVVDEQFPLWMLDGSTMGPNHVTVQIQQTVPDFEQPEIASSDLTMPMFTLADLGTAGLTRWYRLYDDATLRRAVEPTVEVIRGATRFLEPQLMMTAMALEAMGHYRDPDRRRNRPLHEQVQRCMAASHADWSQIGTERGISRAISNTYNDLKHPDRPKRPKGLELALLTELAKLLARMQLIDIIDLPALRRAQFLRSNSFRRVLERFKLNGVHIDDDGTVIQQLPGDA